MTPRHVVSSLLVCAAVSTGPSQAQPSASAPQPLRFTLPEAIQYAEDHYPSIKAALAQVDASAASVDVARAAYLPRVDTLWQSNRGTANNVFGQVLPQSVIPALTGPVLPLSSSQSVWGSAAGALLSWDAFDFGLRHASVAGVEAALAQSRAAAALTRLDVANAVAQAFLSVVTARRTVTSARADVERRSVLLQSVRALVTNELRPGADLSRAEAERAASMVRLLQAQQLQAMAQANLRRLLGARAGPIDVADGALLSSPPGVETPATSTRDLHPLLQVRHAAVEQARAAQEVLARTDRPRIVLQSSVFARGSGANAAGPFDATADGLKLDRTNWAAGVQVVFPNLFDFKALGARRAAAAASARASAAQYDEAVLTIASEEETAAAVLQAARAIVGYTQVQLAAAQQTESRARVRYQAGLAAMVEVAEAQSLLAQAEDQDQVARVNVWRALLATAVAQGDLSPFLTLVRQP
jgi:outer membrane protein